MNEKDTDVEESTTAKDVYKIVKGLSMILSALLILYIIA